MHIKAEGLGKALNGRQVLNNLSFDVKPGSALGILGPGGAGKTTAIRLLLGVHKPDEGQAYFEEKPLDRKVRNVIGYLPQERGLYPQYPLIKVLVHFAKLKGLPRKKAHVESVRLLDRFGMIDEMEVPIAELSQDHREKVQIMATIIHNPDILFLDEPFDGFTDLNRSLVHKMVNRFKEDGKTIILATTEMELAEPLCDEVVFLQHGNTVLKGPVGHLKQKFQDNIILVEGPDNLNLLKKIQGVKKFIKEKQLVRLYVDNQIPAQRVLDIIIKSVNISRIEVAPCSLYDIYLEVSSNGKMEKGGQ